MNQIIPVTDLQTQTKKFIDTVKLTGDSIVITQRGRPAAILVNYDEFQGLLATLEEMSYPDWKERLIEAETDSKAGKGIDLEEYKKQRSARGRKKNKTSTKS